VLARRFMSCSAHPKRRSAPCEKALVVVYGFGGYPLRGVRRVRHGAPAKGAQAHSPDACQASKLRQRTNDLLVCKQAHCMMTVPANPIPPYCPAIPAEFLEEVLGK